jgi:cytochrome P450
MLNNVLPMGKKRNNYPPGPRGKPLFGNLLEFYRDPLDFLLRVASDYGDVVHFKLGPYDSFLINNPEHIKDVLVTNYLSFAKSRGLDRAKILMGEGLVTTNDPEFHRRQRRLIQPAFHRNRVTQYGAEMVECAMRISDGWEDGQTINLTKEVHNITLLIIARSLFGTDLEAETGKIGEAVTTAMEMWPRLALPFSELLDKLPIPSNVRLKRASDYLNKIIYGIINKRRAQRGESSDLISMLLHAKDEEGDGGDMTDQQVRDEVMTLFLAGHETIATALIWTFYLITQNPEVEERLKAELEVVLGGKVPSINDLERLKYTRMVFAEAMRIYPPVWTLARRSIKDYRIDSYVIPANSLIFLSQYVTHRDPRFFNDPLRFIPDRWTPEEEAKRPRFSYYPFGGGPRQCIGDHFAWIEGVLVTATIAQRWELHFLDEHPIKFLPLVTLRSKYDMRMILKKRE